MEHALEPTADPAWVLDADGYDPLRESSLESRFAISNGFLGIRGARAITRGARWVVPPRTYVAGLFDTAGTERATPGLVPAADWLQVRILLAGGPLVHHPGDVSSHRMTLDVRRGVLLTEARQFKAGDVGIRLRTLRLVSLSERAVGLQLIQLEIEDGEVDVTLEASFEGVNLGLVSERLDQDLGVWRTQHSGKGLAMATAASLQIDGHDLPPTALGQLKWSWSWKSRPGQVVCFERSVAVARSDTQGLDPGRGARDKLGVARHLGWRGVVAAHEAAWASRWQCSDVEVDGDAAAQQALRFAVYHLNSAANPADERVSIGARALTGDDYRGHVFWDTEIFLLPFYVMTWPEAARALLMYRFHTLDGARGEGGPDGLARCPLRLGVRRFRCGDDAGAGDRLRIVRSSISFAASRSSTSARTSPTRSGSTGRRPGMTGFCSTPVPRSFSRRRGSGLAGLSRKRTGTAISAASSDRTSITSISTTTPSPTSWRAGTFGARSMWRHCCASAGPSVGRRLASRLGLDDTELKQWLNVAETMATGLDIRTGLFEQFAGFFALEEIDLTNYAGRSVPMDVVLGRERTRSSQVIKQADVVALLGLLPEEFVGETGAANFHYYEPRCGHGSSLSRAMHGLVAARLGYSEMALRYFRQTAAIDLADTHVAIDGGVHIAALGGIWLTAVFGFAGLSLHSDGIALDPKLPTNWRSLGFGLQWRSRRLKIKIVPGQQLVEATLEAGEPMRLVVSGEPHELRRDRTLRVFPEGAYRLKARRPSNTQPAR